MTSPYKKTSHVVIINFGLKFRKLQIVCATKDEKSLKSTAISVTPTAKPTEGNGRNRDSQKNGNKETEGA